MSYLNSGNHKKRRHLRKLYLLIILIVFFQKTYAQTPDNFDSHPILKDNFQFSFGLYLPNENFKITLDAATPGEEIDFNETFDKHNSYLTYFFNFGWHFAKRWKLSAEYFGLENGYKSELEKDLNFNFLIFKKGSFVEIGTGWKLARIYISGSAIKNNKHELGFGLGAHVVSVDASIAGQVLTDQGDLEFEKSSVKATVPLPNIGVWYYFAPSSKWLFSIRTDWFAISISDYGGSLWNIAPGVNYQLLKHFGLGLSYRYFDINVNVDQSEWQGQLNLIHKGPLLSFTANF